MVNKQEQHDRDMAQAAQQHFAKVNSWYTVKNALATDDGPPEILIYDEISPVWGVSAADFVRDLAGIDAPEVTVRINSPGGSVFDGIAILNALRGHDAKVTTVVDGIAASIASVIALGGDTVVMNQNSTLMIHNAWDIVAGNADELQKAADTLRSFSANIASIYADKAGGTVADWQALMDAETWYTADEAVAAGLADEAIVETVKMPAAYARASFDLSKFKHAGREAAPAPIILARNQTPPPQVEAEDNKGKEPPVATLNESIVEVLGLDAEADDDAIKSAVVELKERADKPADPPADPAPVGDPSTEQILTAAAKMGLALVDRAQHEAQASAIAELQAVRAAQLVSDDERLLDDAIKAGKLAPANKSNWLALMDKDRVGIRATLAQLPNGLIPVAPMGHGLGSEEDHLDAEMANVMAKLTGRNVTGKDA